MMGNSYEYYINQINANIKKRRKAIKDSINLSQEEKSEIIWNIYNNKGYLIKSITNKKEAENVLAFAFADLTYDEFENQLSQEILVEVKKKLEQIKGVVNNSENNKIQDFIIKYESLEKSYNEFKKVDLKDTEQLDLLLSNLNNLKQDGILLLKQELSKEEYDKINYKLMQIEELEENMKNFRFLLDESLGDFSRKF